MILILEGTSMEIQDLTTENQYRRPILRPDRAMLDIRKDSNTFRTEEGIVDVTISNDIEPSIVHETTHSFKHFIPFAINNKEEVFPNLENLQNSFEANSTQLGIRLRQYFSSQGIQAPVAAKMTVDVNGRVIVSGDFVQKAALESSFSDDPKLTTLIADLGSSASILRAADVSSNFTKAYEKNPKSAINQFEHLFSRIFKFTVNFESDKLSASFNSESGQSISWWRET
jgi:hypothetical protein